MHQQVIRKLTFQKIPNEQTQRPTQKGKLCCLQHNTNRQSFGETILCFLLVVSKRLRFAYKLTVLFSSNTGFASYFTCSNVNVMSIVEQY